MMIKEPMLAAKEPTIEALISKMSFPMLASRKLDGIRAIVSNHEGINRLYSRKLKLIPNRHIQMMFGRQDMLGLDGELIVGPPNAENVFNVTTSAVMSIDGTPNAVYHVFDDWNDVASPYMQRAIWAHDRVRNLRQLGVCVELVLQQEVFTAEEVRAYHDASVLMGYEGSMFRSPHAPYKQGRSTSREGWLFKCKEWDDAEGTVTGVYELQHNANEAEVNELGRSKRSSHAANMVPMGTLGGFNVLTPDGRSFNLGGGPGLTAAMRQHFWDVRDTLIGRTVKYSFLKVGVVVLPRHPQFLGFRED